MNNEQLIKSLIKQGESEQLEFKEVVQKEAIAKTLCSFLNGEGGRIVIGVKNDGSVIGLPDAESIENKLRDFLIHSIVPEAPITYSVENINKKHVLVLKVWKGSKQPYIFDGGIFFRRGVKTQKATSKEISELIHGRQLSEQHWERQFVVGVTLEDLDKKLILDTIKESQKNKRSNFEGEDISDFLSYFGLYHNGSFTNACVVLFAKFPGRFIPQIRVRLTEYAAGKTDETLIRDKVFEGNLFNIRNELEKYVNALGIRSVFDKNQWKRQDFTFPVKALQEGIINALIHRDYSSFSSTVAISVYPDKFVITNSGQLPDEVEIQDLKKNHTSHPVNPDIAHIVFLRGLIDKLGRGTIKVIEECKQAGLKTPVWKETVSNVVLTFYGPKALPKKKSGHDVVNDALNDAVNNAVRKYLSPYIETFSSSVQKRLVNIIKEVYYNQKVKAVELEQLFKVSKRTIMVDLSNLNKYIQYTGSKKSGGYVLNSEFKDYIDKVNIEKNV